MNNLILKLELSGDKSEINIDLPKLPIEICIYKSILSQINFALIQILIGEKINFINTIILSMLIL
jgi:hypothetical protein